MIRSVDWAILGSLWFGIFLFASAIYENLLLWGFAWGWAACGIFWTYWVQHHGKQEGSTD